MPDFFLGRYVHDPNLFFGLRRRSGLGCGSCGGCSCRLRSRCGRRSGRTAGRLAVRSMGAARFCGYCRFRCSRRARFTCRAAFGFTLWLRRCGRLDRCRSTGRGSSRRLRRCTRLAAVELVLETGLLLASDVLLSALFSDAVLLTALDAELSTPVSAVLLPAHAAMVSINAAVIKIAVIFFFITLP